MKKENTHQYDDIIHLPHPVSKKHPQMSLADRAAQFAPFAALTGHGDAIRETARYTNERAELTEDKKRMLDEQLFEIRKEENRGKIVRITCFEPDQRKEGGRYVTVTGVVSKVDTFRHLLWMEPDKRILMRDIVEIECVNTEKC